MQSQISYSPSLSTGIYGSCIYPNMDPVFVWRDRNVKNAFNIDIFGSNCNEEDIHLTTTTSEAVNIIKKFTQSRLVYIITNGGDNAEQFVQFIRNDLRLKTEIVVFCSAVAYHKTWAAKYNNVIVLNGKSNLRQWAQKIRLMHREFSVSSNPYLDTSISSSFLSNDYNKSYVGSHTKSYQFLVDIDEKKYDVQAVQQQNFKITSDVDLKLDYQMKSKALRDESGFNILPMNIYDTPKPIISFVLDLSYDSWNSDMENDFLSKLAKELVINKHELVILCKSKGSVHFSVLVNAIKTQYHNIKITCAYIQQKAKAFAKSSTLKKFCIKSTQIKEWFKKKLKDNTEKIKSVTITNTGILSGGEEWILNQSKILKRKLNDAVKKLNGVYVVSAICILDNDDALQKFITHPNLHRSKLLFHGTDLNALGSIYKTGLQPRGGSVYGNGSYVTSSPLHSINYMICYKDEYDSKSGEFTLIAAYVNCGNIKQIYDTSFDGKNIENKYDSHYIACVASSDNEKYLGYPLKRIKDRYKVDYKGETANEYAIKDHTRILPRFYITLKKVNKDCFAYFTGLVVSDEYNAGNTSVAYVVDKYSECVGEGKYPRNKDAFPNAVRYTFDGIAIDEGTRVIIWEKENFQGKIWLDQKGPAIINNVLWKGDNRYPLYTATMSKTFKDKDLQKSYPQNRRLWSVSNMHNWSKGSVQVMRV
eukprot:291063_1